MKATPSHQGATKRRALTVEQAEAHAKKMSRKATFVEFLLAATIAVTAGFFSSGFDLWAAGSAQAWFYGVALAASFAIMLALLFWRNQLLAHRQRRGTLYYVRLLPTWMKTRHDQNVKASVPGHPDARVLTRWYVDNAAAIDISETVTEMAGALQQTMNDDAFETDFTIVPELVWPAAMGLGANSYFLERTSIEEADDRTIWNWDPRPIDGNPTTHESDWALTLEKAYPRSAERLHRPTPAPLGGDQPILIRLNLSGEIDLLPTGWSTARSASLNLKADSGRHAVHMSVNRNSTSAVFVEPNLAAARCAQCIFDIQGSNPSAMVVLVTRLPKSVAFALGRRLAEKMDLPGSEAWDPWARLVTVQLLSNADTSNQSASADGTAKPRYDRIQITRVFPSQPSLAMMRQAVAALGQGAIQSEENSPQTVAKLPDPSITPAGTLA